MAGKLDKMTEFKRKKKKIESDFWAISIITEISVEQYCSGNSYLIKI